MQFTKPHLHSHVTCPHLQILSSSIESSEVLLNHNGRSSHFQEFPSVIPSSDTSLKNENFSGKDSISFLLKIEIMSVFEEDFGPSQLIVSLSQHTLANLRSCLSAVHLAKKE